MRFKTNKSCVKNSLHNNAVDLFRDQLKRHYNIGQYWLEVDVDDIASFDENLSELLIKQPAEHLPLVID